MIIGFALHAIKFHSLNTTPTFWQCFYANVIDMVGKVKDVIYFNSKWFDVRSVGNDLIFNLQGFSLFVWVNVSWIDSKTLKLLCVGK